MAAETDGLRHYLRGLSVELPAALRDLTSYQFVDPNDAAHLLQLERVEPPHDGPPTVIAERRRVLRASYGSEGKLLGVASLPDARFSNRYFVFETTLLEPIVLHVGALMPSEEVVVVQYVHRNRRDLPFADILRSFDFSSAMILPVIAGRRQRFDRYTFETPPELEPPARFEFAGGGVRIAFDLETPFAPSLADFARELGGDSTDPLEVIDLPVRDYAAGPRTVRQRSYRVRGLSSKADSAHDFRVAHVVQSGALLVSLFASASPGSADLDGLVRGALSSLRAEGGP